MRTVAQRRNRCRKQSDAAIVLDPPCTRPSTTACSPTTKPANWSAPAGDGACCEGEEGGGTLSFFTGDAIEVLLGAGCC
jgi:hypothetical protein